VATITATDFGAINPGDFFTVGAANFTIQAQLTNNPVSKTWVSGGTFSPVPVNTITLNNTTGLIVGNTLVGPGLPTLGAGITAIASPQVTLDTFFTAQPANFTSTGSTIVPGTGSNGAAVGQGLLTIGTLSTGSIVIGQTLTGTGVTSGTKITANISGSGTGSTWIVSASQTVTSTAITGTSIYAVSGGLGTYSIDNAAVVSGTTQLYDLPEATDYNFFKKITPNGNTATFTNGETITVTVTELPANSQIYRRWFIKSRMGIKKRFGAFSEPSTIDKDGNFQYEPDPGAGSVTVLNITQALVKLDFGNLVIPNNGFLLFRTMNPVDFGNDNNIGSSAQLDLGLVSVVENTVTSATTDVETFVWQIDPT
jgi:hypothetical protein